MFMYDMFKAWVDKHEDDIPEILIHSSNIKEFDNIASQFNGLPDRIYMTERGLSPCEFGGNVYYLQVNVNIDDTVPVNFMYFDGRKYRIVQENEA